MLPFLILSQTFLSASDWKRALIHLNLMKTEKTKFLKKIYTNYWKYLARFFWMNQFQIFQSTQIRNKNKMFSLFLIRTSSAIIIFSTSSKIDPLVDSNKQFVVFIWHAKKKIKKIIIKMQFDVNFMHNCRKDQPSFYRTNNNRIAYTRKTLQENNCLKLPNVSFFQ